MQQRSEQSAKWAAEDGYQRDKSSEQRVKWNVNDDDYDVYDENDNWYLGDDDSITSFNIEL